LHKGLPAIAIGVPAARLMIFHLEVGITGGVMGGKVAHIDITPAPLRSKRPFPRCQISAPLAVPNALDAPCPLKYTTPQWAICYKVWQRTVTPPRRLMPGSIPGSPTIFRQFDQVEPPAAMRLAAFRACLPCRKGITRQARGFM
jgi:hypothetical protein